jgi:hypothetical protein
MKFFDAEPCCAKKFHVCGVEWLVVGLDLGWLHGNLTPRRSLGISASK